MSLMAGILLSLRGLIVMDWFSVMAHPSSHVCHKLDNFDNFLKNYVISSSVR
jgi:hypothetical protein